MTIEDMKASCTAAMPRTSIVATTSCRCNRGMGARSGRLPPGGGCTFVPSKVQTQEHAARFSLPFDREFEALIARLNLGRGSPILPPQVRACTSHTLLGSAKTGLIGQP